MTEKHRPIRGLLAGVTKIVIDRLSSLSPGETVTYDELNRLAKCDVRQKRYALSTAANRLLNERGMVFFAEWNVGIRLATDGEIATLGQRDTARIGNISRRCLRKLVTANYERLTPEERVRHSASTTVMRLFARGSSSKSQRLIEQAVRERAAALPLTETLKLFGRV